MRATERALRANTQIERHARNRGDMARVAKAQRDRHYLLTAHHLGVLLDEHAAYLTPAERAQLAGWILDPAAAAAAA